jgi:hypothetical protein
VERGQIVFCHGKGLLSKIISWFDGNGKFSHVAIAVSDKHVLETDITTNCRINVFNPKDYNYIEIIDLGLTDKDKDKIIHIGLKYIGARYDYIQLIWYVLKRFFKVKGKNRFNNPKNLICSELVWIILGELGILDELGLDTVPHGIDLTPNQLYDLLKYVSK